MSSKLLIELGTIVIITPVFLIVGVVVAIIGLMWGQVYMNVGMVVKRELSRAKAPVLANFGTTVSGLSKNERVMGTRILADVSSV